MNELRQYQCFAGPFHTSGYNTTSPGKAKSEFFRDVSEVFPSLKYIDIRCKCLGKPYTSPRFKKNAKYRGIPFAYCGMKVNVGGDEGVIVGHNSSCNLDILFTTGPYKNTVRNCQPNWMITYYDEEGNVLKEYKQ